jgi:hypothetical protein
MLAMLTVQAAIWVVLAAVIGSLALYRKFVSNSEVDILHLGEGESPAIAEQEILAHRLEAIDRWGKRLTIILIIYGVAIAGGFLFLAWQVSNQPVS